jgi:hypothetical protein
MSRGEFDAWQALQVKPTMYHARKKPREKHVTIVPIISIIFTVAVLFILCL